MKPHQEDTRLSAYVLGELSQEETLKLDHEVASDPALRLAVTEIEKRQAILTEALGGNSYQLLPRQKNEIMRAAKEATRDGQIVELKSHRQIPVAWIWPVGAAAVIGGGLLLLSLLSPPENKPIKKSVAKGGDGVSQLESRGIQAVDESSARIPLITGDESLLLIRSAIREKDQLPHENDVRVEEILNAFPLKAKNSVAISSGCSIGTEIVQCPWKPSASLLFVHVRGDRNSDKELAVTFHRNERVVSDFSVFGYQIIAGTAGNESAELLKKGDETFVAIFVDGIGKDLGRINWSVDGEEAPPILLSYDRETKVSSDARFASLICSFGMWLKDDTDGVIDDEMLLGLAREAAAENEVPDRYDFLALIEQAIQLNEQ
ncbi:MAG: von Willebrand factor type A domain-containing protein [Akkermansiaceae bacterium]